MTKPREKWDQEDRFDYLDGWHEESDPAFRSRRRRDRVSTSWRDEAGVLHEGGDAAERFEQGRADRRAHRERTGL